MTKLLNAIGITVLLYIVFYSGYFLWALYFGVTFRLELAPAELQMSAHEGDEWVTLKFVEHGPMGEHTWVWIRDGHGVVTKYSLPGDREEIAKIVFPDEGAPDGNRIYPILLHRSLFHGAGYYSLRFRKAGWPSGSYVAGESDWFEIEIKK